MKTLYFVRHAKSSWEEPGKGDMERPLLQKGITKTKKIIGFLKKRDTRIDLMISSPAVRALETAKLIANGLGYPVKKIKTGTEIYNGSPDSILELICGTPDDVDSLMIFGHNPGITNLANLFLDTGIEMLPTTGVACISFEADTWKNLASEKTVLEFVISPKMIDQHGPETE